MDTTLRDQCADEILSLLPLYHKKILHPKVSGLQRAQFRVLGVLMRDGTLPTTEIGRRLYISKPYMTALVDSLMEEKLVERQPYPEDRRVIRIAITPLGKQHLKEALELYRADVRKLLLEVSTRDLEELGAALATVRRILSTVP